MSSFCECFVLSGLYDGPITVPSIVCPSVIVNLHGGGLGPPGLSSHYMTLLNLVSHAYRLRTCIHFILLHRLHMRLKFQCSIPLRNLKPKALEAES
jgi:hypothetical protein